MDETSTRNSGAHGGVFRRILVCYDGSSGSRRALHVAQSLADDVGGTVELLIVIRPPAHAETSDARDEAIETERRELSAGLDEEVGNSKQRTVGALHEVIHENPADAIALFAKQHGFDLVVVGTHGRERVAHRGVGRSLEALLRQHPCPLLVV